MFGRVDPTEAYRLISRDAHIQGADGNALVGLCFEEVIAALDRAIFATEARRWDLRSRALSRAAAGITALRKGVTPDAALSGALLEVYGAASAAILKAAGGKDSAVLHRVRLDMDEIAAALSGLRQAE